MSSTNYFILVVGRSCQDYCLYYSLVSRWTFCYHNYNNWISIPASLQIVLINSKRSLQFSQFILDYLFTSQFSNLNLSIKFRSYIQPVSRVIDKLWLLACDRWGIKIYTVCFNLKLLTSLLIVQSLKILLLFFNICFFFCF